jgi:hypothetical protein
MEVVVWVEAEVLGMVEGTGVGREGGRGEEMVGVVVMVVGWVAGMEILQNIHKHTLSPRNIARIRVCRHFSSVHQGAI